MSHNELFVRSPGEDSFESYLRLVNGLDQLFPTSQEEPGLAGFRPLPTYINDEPGFVLAGASEFAYLSILARNNASTEYFPESPYFYVIGESVSLGGLMTMRGHDFCWIHTLPTSNERVKDASNDIRYTLGRLARVEFDFDLSKELAEAIERDSDR